MFELSPFHHDLYSLLPIASVNRVLYVDLPEYPVDKKLRDEPVSHQLWSGATLDAVREQANALGIADSRSDGELMARFNACFESKDEAIQTQATRIASRKARYFSHLLRTLKEGDNHSARAEWDERHWQHWASIRQIVLGGGQLRGNYGRAIHEHIFHLLADLELDISLSRFGAILPLIGAARFAPSNTSSAIVMDFGSTNIKRGLAHYRDDQLAQLQILPALTSFCDDNPAIDSQMRWSNFWQKILQSWLDVSQTYEHIPDAMLISLASYVESGQPFEQHGCYQQLAQLSDNFENFLAQTVAQELHENIYLRLIHDGTAAASAYAGYQNTAVLTLGTWFGIGFAPPDEAFRPLHPEFSVEILGSN